MSPQRQESKKMRRRKNNRIEPCVTVRAEDNNGDPERMIRRFRKMVKMDGIIDEVRSRRYFKAPSEKRREEKQERQRLINKVNKRRDELLKPRDRYKKRRS
jgi:ribosomal protein S21